VTVTTQHTRRHPGIRARRTTRFDPRDWTTVQGIPVTSVARTALDCAADLDAAQLRRLVREAMALELVTIAELADVLARLAPCRGSAKLAAIVAEGHVPTKSELEDVVLAMIVGGGLQRPDVNEPLLVDGRRIVPDFRWADQRLVVEADSRVWHDHRLAREDDAERQAVLEAHGETVLRVTWEQAVRRPRQTLARLRAAGAPPCRVSSCPRHGSTTRHSAAVS
jgi:hypothetical protein